MRSVRMYVRSRQRENPHHDGAQIITSNEPSYRVILHQAWPAIVANAAVPLLGLADTALVTQVGSTPDLGAVALSVLVFNCLYWALGFLRMSTTGLAAQAVGANTPDEVGRIVKRALVLGAALGIALTLGAAPFTTLALNLLAPEPTVGKLARVYIEYRIWGAPAVLINYAVTGALIALGRMRYLLVLQLFLNIVNLVANLVLVLVIRGSFAGLAGIAVGTACAEWLAAALGLILLASSGVKGLGSWSAWRADIVRTGNALAWRGLLVVNLNILARTFALLLGFAWFTRAGAQFGNETLASNHLLQQFISFAAFFLDGIAFVTETFVGRAIGAKNVSLLRTAVARTSVVALAFGLLLALGVLLAGPSALSLLAPTEVVRTFALSNLPIAAAYVLVGVLPWQLDGIFIGAACGVALRNAAVVSLLAFGIAVTTLGDRYGNVGLWWAMLVYIAMRGAALLAYWPQVVRLAQPTAAIPNQP
jgi:multidrug resistance protein, MATE family